MLCSHCGKNTSEAAAKCVHCGARMQRATTRAGTPIVCPHCAVEARIVAIGRLEIDVCDTCGTTWFDKGELDTARDAADSNARASFRAAIRALHVRDPAVELQPYVSCPVCQTALRRRSHPELSGIAAYGCGEHGAWVERRQLLRLIAELETHGGGEARRRAEQWAAHDEERRRAAAERARSIELPDPHASVALDWSWLWFWID